MHPALSVIVFTTVSGAGYGLLAWLGVWAMAGWLPADRGLAAASLGLSLGAITIGLLSSTLHLGHPERAWRAFSQWRTSWLSREGVASVATYAPALLLALGWIVLGRHDGLYAWANTWVVPGYGVLALMTGALWLAALLALWDAPRLVVAAIAAASIAAAAWT